MDLKVFKDMKSKQKVKLNESGYTFVSDFFCGSVPEIKTLGIISAGNVDGKTDTTEYNNETTEQLKHRIRQINLGYIRIKSKYGKSGHSILIPNILKKELLVLGNDFWQQSIVYGKKAKKRTIEGNEYDVMEFEMIYTTDNDFGKVTGKHSVLININNKGDMFSILEGRKFQLPFFDEEFEKVVWKPDSGIINKECFTDSNLIRELNETLEEIFEENRTAKQRWLTRGYIKNKLYEIFED